MKRRRPRTPPPARETVRIEIDSIAAGGEGVGRLPDGRAVFVHRTAPGEVVDIEVTRNRPRWARGRLLRIVHAAPERRTAPCPHYAECGGCTLEHLEYPAQLASKSRIVHDALQRIGNIRVDAPAVVPSPREFRYRNRVSFGLRRGSHGRVYAGFHALNQPARIATIDGRCMLPEEPISRVWEALRANWGPDANRLPSGETLRLTLRTTSAGNVSLLVEGGYSRGRPEELLELVADLDAIWYSGATGAFEHIAGAPGLPEVWGDEQFEVQGAAFLQVNRFAAPLLESHVLGLAGSVEGLAVVDAYCGVGLHARRLARAGARVTGIELDPEAVRVATAAASEGARFLRGRVEDLLPETLPADILILNPPRAGVESAAIDAILAAPPERILYVSCDPATLARDLKRLGGTFFVASIRCFDLFPQTAHVETVVELRLTPAIGSATDE